MIDRLSIKCFHKPLKPPKAMLKSKLSTFEKMEKSEQKRKICVGFLALLKKQKARRFERGVPQRDEKGTRRGDP